MSTHPNVLLVLALTPDDLSRKTLRRILEDSSVSFSEQITIGSEEYFFEVMEDDYSQSYQISGKEGDIIFFDMVTYGYGEVIEWDGLERRKSELEEWAKIACEKYSCEYRIFVTANYW